MRKIIQKTGLLICMLFCLQFSYASLPVSTKKDSVAINNSDEAKRELILRISKMSVKEYEIYTGRKMSFFEKLSFKAYKKKMAARAAMGFYDDDSEGFNLGGFAVGLILGGIGVLLTYIFSKDRNKRKWAWIGWGTWIVIVLAVFFITKN